MKNKVLPWTIVLVIVFVAISFIFGSTYLNLSPPPRSGLQKNENTLPQDAFGSSLTGQDLTSFNKMSECKAPIYLSTTFPPSPVTLPPLPPPRGPYEEPNHICRHFSFEFCQDLKKKYGNNENLLCQALWFDSHAINLVVHRDEKGKWWLCFVEPQTSEYTCIDASSVPSGLKPWIQDTLCQEYYKFPPEDCKKEVYVLPLCEDFEGSRCTNAQVGEGKICLTGGDGAEDVTQLVCKCTYNPYEVCSWQFPLSTGATATR